MYDTTMTAEPPYDPSHPARETDPVIGRGRGLPALVSGTNARPFTRIMILDPQPVLGELLVERLRAREPRWSFEHAASIAETRALLAKTSDALLLSSLRLADGGVLDLAAMTSANHPGARIVLWTEQYPMHLAGQLSRLGMLTFMPRSWPLERLLRELLGIARAGSQPLDHIPEQRVQPGSDPAIAPESEALLSLKQTELLLMFAEGLTVKEVAQRLRMTVKAVDSLKYRLMKHLGVHDRVELTRLAIREGFIDP